MPGRSIPGRRASFVASTAFLIWVSILSAGAAEAQGPARAPVPPDVEVEDQADLLLAGALEHDRTGTWLLAALAYESSAKLRSAHDPRRAEEFASSGRAYQAGGYSREAVGMWVEAGRSAEEQGDPDRAAESFRNAALLSAEMGRSRQASDYALRACSIVERGSLAPSQRRDALNRLGCPQSR